MTFAENIGEDVMVSGKFGEALLAYWLVKQKLKVIFANTVGFDLLVVDKKKKIFSSRRMIGISVKARQQNSPSFGKAQVESWIKKMNDAEKSWDLEPYFCLITSKEILLFPVEIAKNKSTRTYNGRLSFSKIRNLKSMHRYEHRKRIILLKWRIWKDD